MKEKKEREYKTSPVLVVIVIILLIILGVAPMVLRMVIPKEVEPVYTDTYTSLMCTKTLSDSPYTSIKATTTYHNEDLTKLVVTYVYNSEFTSAVENNTTLLPEGSEIPLNEDGIIIKTEETQIVYDIPANNIIGSANQYLANLANGVDAQQSKFETDGYICNKVTG